MTLKTVAMIFIFGLLGAHPLWSGRAETIVQIAQGSLSPKDRNPSPDEARPASRSVTLKSIAPEDTSGKVTTLLNQPLFLADQDAPPVMRENSKPLKPSGRIHSCNKFLDLPALLKGCEGEACGVLRYNKAIRDTTLYASPSSSAKVVDHVSRCEPLSKFEPHIRLLELGSALVRAPGQKLQAVGASPGDQIPIVNSIGEGYFTACIADREIEVYWGDSSDLGASAVDVTENAKTEAWIRLTTPRGISGYARDRGSRFYMGYYDFDPTLFCPGDQPEIVNGGI